MCRGHCGLKDPRSLFGQLLPALRLTVRYLNLLYCLIVANPCPGVLGILWFVASAVF